MSDPWERYNKIDTSEHGFKFESKYFPAFFRLFKWKLLDYCVLSTRDGGLGEFKHFEPLFEDGQLKILVQRLLDETLPVDEYQEKLDNSSVDDKARRQAEAFIKYRVAHKFRLNRRKTVEYFFTKVLFNEQGLRIADMIMFNNCTEIYEYVHMLKLPAGWDAAVTFKEKFYIDEEVEKPFEMQLLDRVVGSSRGNLFLRPMRGNQHCENEVKRIDDTLKNTNYMIESDLVKGVLDEGPNYLLEKNSDGDDVRGPLVTWTEHMTRLIFLSFPCFNVGDKLKTKRHEDWYYALVEAMSFDPYNRAGLYFLNRNYEEELREIGIARQRERLALMKKNQTEEDVVREVVKEIRPQPRGSGYESDVENAELLLRNYQMELVQTALEGKNVVIVAPTGSGKTEVAIYAALNHIKSREQQKKPARVVMLVPKIPLVGQQKERFLKYCRGRYKVEGFHGSEESKTNQGRRDDVLSAHVVIMTPQILVNMWQSVRQSERVYVSDFSMIVFDEVHKASGAHPYVEISQMVEDWEYEKPQIIGLTASLNVNIVGNVDNDQMYNSIYQMLAILNTPHLSAITKQENIDELNSFVGKPDDSVEICKDFDSNDPVRGFINQQYKTYSERLIIELDLLQKARTNCFSPGNFKNLKNAKIAYYEQYEGYLQNIIRDLVNINVPEKKIALLYASYVKTYVEARGIAEIMPASTAFDFLEEAMEALDRSHKLPTQFNHFDRQKEDLRRTVLQPDEERQTYPEIVKKLMATLTGQFEVNENSRVIIFVTQRSTAKRVCDFLNKARIFDQFRKPGDGRYVVGYVLGSNNSGGKTTQTQQEQTENIEKFNNGRLKVIVATSVVEEGLDVAACNLIIKYNCSSGSAIQLVQQRGRARAKNSRSVLLSVSNSINDKENNALLSEKYMKLCVSKIMKLSANELKNNVERLKKLVQAERARQAKEREMHRVKLGDSVYKIKCAGCTRVFCMSSDVKKVYSNYLVFNPDVWSHLQVERKKGTNKYLSEETQPLSLLNCLKCLSHVGKAYKIRGVYLPMFEVRHISFQKDSAAREEPLEAKVKWGQVEEEFFYVANPVQKDFEMMLSAFSGSEESLKKKQILDFDSAQHIRDIDRVRLERNRLKEEEKRKLQQQSASSSKSIIPTRKVYSDDEGEKEGGEDGEKKNEEKTDSE